MSERVDRCGPRAWRRFAASRVGKGFSHGASINARTIKAVPLTHPLRMNADEAMIAGVDIVSPIKAA